MSAEQAVVTGLGVVFFGMAYIAFKLNDSENDLIKYTGLIFLSLSLAVLNMLGWTLLEIANANAMSYVVNGLTTGLLWVINIAMFMFWLIILLRSLIYMSIFVMDWVIKKLRWSSDG